MTDTDGLLYHHQWQWNFSSRITVVGTVHVVHEMYISVIKTLFDPKVETQGSKYIRSNHEWTVVQVKFWAVHLSNI